MGYKLYWCIFHNSPVCLSEKVTVQKRIRMNAAAQMAAVSAPIWAPCVNVTQASGWTTPARAVQVCTHAYKIQMLAEALFLAPCINVFIVKSLCFF